MIQDRREAALRHVRTLFSMGTVSALTDGQLLERFVQRGGEAAETAFAALVERHGAMVLRVCRRVLADPHDAQDAFQATFLVLVRRADSIRNSDSLASWLHGVAYRTACCARSATARRRRHERRAARTVVAQAARDDDPCDLGRLLHEELDRLPERYRAAIVLCDLEGRTHEQAAWQLGCPVGTVKSRLARGRERLRDRLTRRGLAPAVGVIGVALSSEVASAAESTTLADSTVQAAIHFAASREAVAEAVSASVAELTEGVLKMMLQAKLKTAGYFVVAVGILFGVGVVAQQKEANPSLAEGGGQSTRNKALGRPSLSARKGPTFNDLKPDMVLMLQEHGSLEVKHVGKFSVRVVVESLEEFERASPLLERMFEVLDQEPVSMGWVNREEELKNEIRLATGKWPDPLAVSQELRLRDMEHKLDQVVKALDGSKRERGR